VLTNLRKICNHPSLFVPAAGAEEAGGVEEQEEGTGAAAEGEFDPDQSGEGPLQQCRGVGGTATRVVQYVLPADRCLCDLQAWFCRLLHASHSAGLSSC